MGIPKFISSKTSDAIRRELKQKMVNMPDGQNEEAYTEIRTYSSLG
jgi:hypothetical protein